MDGKMDTENEENEGSYECDAEPIHNLLSDGKDCNDIM